ncbi:MAG: AMP-binding protein [Eubacteriales bacterium]|nr:AMP-binding protein [Eubacteriales bacterium]
MKKGKIYEVRNITDLKDLLNQSSELFGDKSAFYIKGKDDKYFNITYSEFKNDVDSLGTSLVKLGLKDKFVAVMGENRYEWCTSYLSIANGVGVVVPLDKELPPAEMQNLLTRSNAAAIIYSGKYQGIIDQIEPELPDVRHFINMDSDEDQGRFLSYSRLVDAGKEILASGDSSYTDAKIDPEVLGVLLFTSGTTNLAKGVMLSHKNLVYDIMAIKKMIDVTSEDSILSILPIHHTFECTCGFLFPIYTGVRISFNEGLKHISKNLIETSPSLMIVVPLLLEGMYKKIWEQAEKKGMAKKLRTGIKISNLLRVIGIDMRKKLFKDVLSNFGGKLRFVIAGAAALDPAVSKFLYDIGINALQGYGLTECSPVVTGNREDCIKHHTIGYTLPGVEMKIVNMDKHGVGEFAVRGGNVMLGYFQNPEATEQVLKDGWFYTGDLGTVDKDGFFTITGRQKNVIVTKNGKNIFPEEVESYLNKSPYILESLVWGREDENSDETRVCAEIVPDMEAIKSNLTEASTTKEQLLKLISAEVKKVNKLMPHYKQIKNFEIRLEEFVKTTTKKIKRYVERNNNKQKPKKA